MILIRTSVKQIVIFASKGIIQRINPHYGIIGDGQQRLYAKYCGKPDLLNFSINSIAIEGGVHMPLYTFAGVVAGYPGRHDMAQIRLSVFCGFRYHQPLPDII